MPLTFWNNIRFTNPEKENCINSPSSSHNWPRNSQVMHSHANRVDSAQQPRKPNWRQLPAIHPLIHKLLGIFGITGWHENPLTKGMIILLEMLYIIFLFNIEGLHMVGDTARCLHSSMNIHMYAHTSMVHKMLRNIRGNKDSIKNKKNR